MSTYTRNLEALGEELLETLVFDDNRVFERLHLSCISDEFVEKCSLGLLTNPTTVAAKQDLEAIVQQARGEKEEEYIEEFDDPEIGKIGSRESEAVMYESLVRILMQFFYSFKMNLRGHFLLECTFQIY